MSLKLKVTLAVSVLIIGFVIFGYDADRLIFVRKLVHNVLESLQEFASKDVIGIV